MQKSIILLSGGLDSSVNLAKAVNDTKVELALTFDYGQKAADKEIAAAEALCKHYQVKHETVNLPFLKAVTKTALVAGDCEIPLPGNEDLDSAKAFDTAAKVWVPNRNGLFVNVAACYAESMACDLIITGFNAEEAVTFPDNSQSFIDNCNGLLKYSTQSEIRVMSYTIELNKKEIVRMGRELGLPFNFIWSCYFGGEEPCGKCESCLRYLRCVNDAN